MAAAVCGFAAGAVVDASCMLLTEALVAVVGAM